MQRGNPGVAIPPALTGNTSGRRCPSAAHMNDDKEGTLTTKQTQQRGQPADGVTAQAQELAAQAKEQAQEKVEEVKGHASDRLHEQIDSQSTNLAERVARSREALRKAGEYLDSQDSGPAAKLAGQAADRAEAFASYLEQAKLGPDPG